MDSLAREQVALFIDFENLVYGIQDPNSKNHDSEEVDPEPLVQLAGEYGRVVLARAYADWRNKHFNQYQVDLYKLGIDLVHVFGKKGPAGFKNAVDIKMAVDAIESIFAFPDVTTFVIVSGDRDFIHVLKMLRRYGRHIVGISPARSASQDLAQLTDRFLRYEALTETYFQQPGETTELADTARLEALRKSLREIMSDRPEGVRGSELKGILRRRLSATFDESEYGFSRFIDLVRAFPNDLRIRSNPNGGDVSILPAADAPVAAKPSTNDIDESRVERLIAQAKLRRYRYERDPGRRRRIVKAMYGAMLDEPFSQVDIFDRVQVIMESEDLSNTELSKYFMILFQSRVFMIEKDQEDLPARARKMTLNKQIRSDDDLVKRYETSVVYKVLDEATEGPKIKSRDLQLLLGLDDSRDSQRYVSDIEQQARKMLNAG